MSGAGRFGHAARPVAKITPVSAACVASRLLVAARMMRVLRLFRDQPLYAITFTITLALASGAAATSFAVVKRALLDPLPYPEGDRLVTSRPRPMAASARSRCSCSRISSVHSKRRSRTSRRSGFRPRPISRPISRRACRRTKSRRRTSRHSACARRSAGRCRRTIPTPSSSAGRSGTTGYPQILQWSARRSCWMASPATWWG